jgi:cytochrome c553
MKTVPIRALAVVALLTAACAPLERSRDLGNPAASGQTLAEQVCSNCHGLDGNSISPTYPRLAGQTAEYLSKQLNDFRAHGRSDPVGAEYMWGLSQHLTDEQIAGLAAYFARQVAHPPKVASTDVALLASGRKIFENGVPEQGILACVTCHGPLAEGNTVFPRLRYQHADYIVKQLDVFQNSHGRPDTPMDAVVQPLTPEIKRAVAAYLESLPDPAPAAAAAPAGH